MTSPGSSEGLGGAFENSLLETKRRMEDAITSASNVSMRWDDLRRILDAVEQLRLRNQELEQERDELQGLTVATGKALAEERLRNQTMREALDAYAAAYPCPGLLIEPGLASGCNGSAEDCPICAALSEPAEPEGEQAAWDARVKEEAAYSDDPHGECDDLVEPEGGSR